MSNIQPKRPIAPLPPAPSRFGVPPPKYRPPDPDDEISESTSDEELPLVSRDMYAELEGADEEFEEEVIVDEEDIADRDEIIKARIEAGQEEMRSILMGLNEHQLQRYETFRRVGFPRPMIKKVIQRVIESIAGGKDKISTTTINPSTVIVIAGIAKVFVGELIEEARAVAIGWGDGAMEPLRPSHVIEAQRRIERRNQLRTCPNYCKGNRLF